VANIRSEYVKVNAGDVQLDAFLATPAGDGLFPGVVVIQEIFGVNEHIRDVTERFAREGFVAIAPPIYQRQAPGFEVGYDEESFALGRECKDRTTAAQLLNDVRAAIAYLQALPSCKMGGVGTIGFCFGGHVVYLAATLPEVAATASFYGAGIAVMTPGGGEPTITRTADINNPIHLFFGTEDPLIPNEQVDQIEAALKQQQIPHALYRYEGRTHGFFCDRRDSYDAEAAADAWAKTLALFRDRL